MNHNLKVQMAHSTPAPTGATSEHISASRTSSQQAAGTGPAESNRHCACSKQRAQGRTSTKLSCSSSSATTSTAAMRRRMECAAVRRAVRSGPGRRRWESVRGSEPGSGSPGTGCSCSGGKKRTRKGRKLWNMAV